MIFSIADNAVSALQPGLTFGQSLRRRMVPMAVLWLALGVVVGTGVVPGATRAIEFVAGALAGMIVLFPVGLALGLAGGKWKETLVGAAVGQLTGYCVGALGHWGDPKFLAMVGLIYGGLVGATVVGVFYRLPRWLLARVPVRSR